MLELVICVVALVIAGWAIAKNYDAKVVLFATGLIGCCCDVRASGSQCQGVFRS